MKNKISPPHFIRFFLIVFLFVVTFVGCTSSTIGSVNGLPVYQQELEVYKDNLRGNVAGFYAQTYQIETMGEDFWTTSFDGVTPEDTLNEKATKALVRDKVVQKMAMERGITAPGDFKELEKARAQRNQPTEDDLTFGPEEYDVSQYLSYQMTHTEDDLKKYIEATESPTEKELRDAFDSLPDTLKQQHFSAEGYFFTSSEDTPEKLLDYLESLPLTEHEIKHLKPSIVATFFAIESQEVHREDLWTLHLVEEFYSKEAGDFVLFDDAVYWIQRMEGGGLLTYEEAPGLGKNKWINDTFDAWVEKEISLAEVSIKSK